MCRWGVITLLTHSPIGSAVQPAVAFVVFKDSHLNLELEHAIAPYHVFSIKLIMNSVPKILGISCDKK